MSRYYFAGTDRYLGRFGWVKQGDTIDLTDEEAAKVQGNILFARVPTASAGLEAIRREFGVSASYSIQPSQRDTTFIVEKPDANPLVITLPVTTGLECGWRVQVKFSPYSANTSAIDIDTAGTELINGGASYQLLSFLTVMVIWNGKSFDVLLPANP